MEQGYLDDLVVSQSYQYTGKGFDHKLPTGIITLDIALAGGIPLDGSIIEIFGEESAGKSTMSCRICKKCTDTATGYVTWVDSELSYDPDWASVQGLNPQKVISYRPPYMEAAMTIIIDDIRAYRSKYLPWLDDPDWRPSNEHAAAAGCSIKDIVKIKDYLSEQAPVHMIVWDSLAASPVKSVAESGSGFEQGMAYRARLIKMFLSRYQVAVVGCDKIGMILINQVIDNIGSYTGGVTTPGGRGLRHGKHLSIYMKKSGGEKDADSFKITDYTIIALTKNKVTPVIASFPVIFSKSRGFLGATSIYEYLTNCKWFRNAGSWKKFDYERTDPTTGEILHEEISFQQKNFYDLIQNRPELFKYLGDVILNRFIEKFPFSTSLKSTDVSSIVEACVSESSFIPDQSEIDSITEESGDVNDVSNVE